MIDLNFRCSKSDYCPYTFADKRKHYYLLLYVDDILIASDCIDLLNNLKSKFIETFKMRRLSYNYNFFWIQISINIAEKFITFDQSSAIENLVKIFNVEGCKTKTSIERKLDLKKNTDDNLKTKLLIGNFWEVWYIV